MESRAQSPLLQEGRGIDHLVVIVRSLQSSAREFSELLGFQMSDTGRHPQGTENSVAMFQDDTYLELLSVYDPIKAKDTASYLEKFEGAVSVGVNVGSADATATFLRSRGVEYETGSGTIKFDETDDGVTALWKWVGLKPGISINDSVFFIEYTPERVAFRKRHPEHYNAPVHSNTAKSLTSVWAVSKDLSEGTKAYQTIGLHVETHGKMPSLDAEYSEFQVGLGTILLLAPTKPSGKTARFIQRRGEQAIMGASVQLRSLVSAQRFLDKNGVKHLDYTGIYGPSLLIDPEQTHGFWLELYEE